MSTSVKRLVEGLSGLQYSVGDMDEFTHHGADDEHGRLSGLAQARPEGVGGVRGQSKNSKLACLGLSKETKPFVWPGVFTLTPNPNRPRTRNPAPNPARWSTSFDADDPCPTDGNEVGVAFVVSAPIGGIACAMLARLAAFVVASRARLFGLVIALAVHSTLLIVGVVGNVFGGHCGSAADRPERDSPDAAARAIRAPVRAHNQRGGSSHRRRP